MRHGRRNHDRFEGASMHLERTCWCHRCHEGHMVGEINGIQIPYAMTQMIVCPTCGNKRCPHASDHRLACTGSNAPGQPGSVYK